MSVIITFRENAPRGSHWACRRWVFDQLAGDVARAFPHDTELNSAMRSGQIHDGLSLKLNENGPGLHIITSIRQVALNLIEKRTPLELVGMPPQKYYMDSYLEVLSNLVAKIDEEVFGPNAGIEPPDNPPRMSNPSSPGPIATPLMIYHIIDSRAVRAEGHSALIVPNGNGCAYYSYADDNHVDVAEFNNIDDALLAASAAGYDMEQHWACDDQQAASARETAMAFDGTSYNRIAHNSWHMVRSALKAAQLNALTGSDTPHLGFRFNKKRAIEWSYVVRDH